MGRLSDDDMAQLLTEFLVETREGLDQIEGLLLELEQDPSNRSVLESVFRTMHTIKGSAGFLGLSTLEGIAHVAEDILTRAMEGTLILTPAAVTALLGAADALSTITSNLENDGNEGDDEYAEIKQRLKTVNEGMGKRTTRMTQKVATAKAPLAGQGESWGLFDDDDESDAEKADTKRIEAADAVVEVDHSATQEAAASLEADPPSAQTPTVVTQAPATPAPAAQAEAAQQKSFAPAKVESTIRIDVNLLDKLMNLVGELVLSRNQLLQFGEQYQDAGFTAVLHRASLVTSELQENVMKARMQPIGTVFSKFPRIVRDLAMQSNKKIELVTRGEGTELDRTIHEGIRDPLVHLIRNACDHGIEKPDVRAASGKPEQGTIEIAAYHEGGQITIDIKDDGAGINVERVKEKAIEKGVITQARAQTISDREARELILLPGFSTAAQITNISGRGVGMDVVKTNIEKIGGTLEIESEMGKGSTLRVRIPLTLAIIPALVVRAGADRFAIPQISLRELVRVEEGGHRKIEDVRGAEVLRLRGKLLPLVRLADTLGVESQPLEEGVENIVVVHTGEKEIGVVVDNVHDVEEIVVKPLSRQLKDLKHFAGATIMGDGRVALIVDVAGLGSMVGDGVGADQARKAQEESGDEPHGSGDRQSLLLVSLGENDRFAIPLGLVSRLEEFAPSHVEVVDGREVIQYRGDILPLVDAAKYFEVEEGMEDYDAPVSVIVFQIEEGHVGLKVRRIVDVVEAEVRIGTRSEKPGVVGSCIIDERTTIMLDVFGLIAQEDHALVAGKKEIDSFSSASSAEARILVVDDSQFYRALIEGYLKALGHTVVTAINGVEGMKALESQSFDIVVSDLDMPEMNGFEFAKAVRAKGTMNELPMVACSSLSDPSIADRALAAGFTKHMLKLDQREMIETIDELLAQVVGGDE